MLPTIQGDIVQSRMEPNEVTGLLLRQDAPITQPIITTHAQPNFVPINEPPVPMVVDNQEAVLAPTIGEERLPQIRGQEQQPKC